MSNIIDFADVYYHLGGSIKKEITNNIKLTQYEIVRSDEFIDDDYIITDYVDVTQLDGYGDAYNYHIFKDKMVTFNTYIYLDDMLKSHHYQEDDVWRQFSMDLPRSTVMIDNEKIESIDIFKQKFRSFEHLTIMVGGRKYCLLTIMAMLCNQESYYFPYALLFKIYDCDRNSTHITCLSTNRYVHFKTVSSDGINALEIYIMGTFVLKDKENNKTLVQMDMTLNLMTNLVKDSKDAYKLLDKKEIFGDNGMILWNE